MAFHFHKHTSPGWYYFAVGNWQPFAFLNHSGWFYLNVRWLWMFAVTEPVRRFLRLRGVWQ